MGSSNKDEIYDDNWPLFERILGYMRYFVIRKYIIGEKPLICVDVGCGFNGRFLFSIQDKIKQGYGFDIRANEVEKGNIKIINNSKYGGSIPLEDNSVDRVFLLAVLEHLDEDDMVGIIRDSVRILRQGGKLVITTPTRSAKGVLEFMSFRMHIISEESIREHKHYFNKQELVEIVQNNGCECEKYKTFQVGFNQLVVGKKK